jgi:hypothetical protein
MGIVRVGGGATMFPGPHALDQETSRRRRLSAQPDMGIDATASYYLTTPGKLETSALTWCAFPSAFVATWILGLTSNQTHHSPSLQDRASRQGPF